MRDVFANQYMTQLAQGKASAVVLSNTSSSALRKNRADIAAELNLLDDSAGTGWWSAGDGCRFDDRRSRGEWRAGR